jgi:hypothetical protein
VSVRLPLKVSILIDTNLAILLCVGISGTRNIEKHKRLAGYDEQDFYLLTKILGDDPKLVFSPYVLGETSNLVRQVANPLKSQLAKDLREMVLRADEIQVACSKIVDDDQYLDLGITDAALLTILEAHPKLVLLTEDANLYIAASQRGYSACNFSHVRDQRPDFK